MHASSGVFFFNLFQFYQKLKKLYNFQLFDFITDDIAMGAASYTYMVRTKIKNNKKLFLTNFPKLSKEGKTKKTS